MKKQVLLLILALTLFAGKATGQDCTITGPAATTTVCVDGVVTLSISATGGPPYAYQWYSNTTNSNSGGADLGSGSGAQTTSYTPPTTSVGTIYYYCIVTGTGCGPNPSTVATITVVADPSWTSYSLPSPTSLCVGGTVAFSVSVNDGLGGAITWIRSSTPGGAGTTVTTGDAPGIGTWYYRPHYTPTGTGCDLADGTETTVTVVADPSWTSYSLPSPTSLCVGGTVAFSVSVNDGLGGAITWIRSSTPGGAGTTVTTGDAPGIGTWYYRPHYTPTGTGCDLADGTETTVTVVADPSWTSYSLPSPTSLCVGGTVAFSVSVNDGLGGAITWIRSSTPGGAGTTVTTGDAPGIGTWYYRPHYTPTGTGCDLADGTETTVTVVADPSWTSYSLPSPTSLCVGGTVAFSVSVNDGLGGAITWIRSSTPGGAGTTVTTGDAPGIGTWYYRPHYTPTGTGCDLADGTETTVTVVADPSWTSYSLPSPTSLCVGGTVAFSVSVNDGLGGAITWIRSSTPGGAGTTVTTGDAPGIGTWYYRPHYTPTGTGCDLADGTETTVTEVADPSWTSYSLPSPTSLCVGGTVAFSVSVNDGLGGAITWIRSSTPGGAGTTVTTGDAPGIGTWYYRPHYTPTGTGCDLADGTETTVTVVADPSWTSYSLPSPTSLCVGGTVAFSVSVNDGLGGAITWIRSSTPGGAGTTVTTGDAPGIGTWYYRPHYTPTGTGCDLADGTETTVTVVADPSWTSYSLPSPTSLCVGGTVAFSVSVNDGLGGAITWIRSSTPGGAGTTVTTGDAPGIGTWYYRPHYTPTGTGCDLADGTETTVTVVADPSWTSYSLPSPTLLCVGGTVAFSVSVNDGLGGAITWIRSSTPGGAGTTVTTGDAPGIGTWYYRPHYTPTGTGCDLADGTETTVTVVADPSWTSYSLPSPTSLCVGGTVAFSVSVNDGLGGAITWIRSSTPGGAGTTVTTGDAPGIGTWYYRPHYTPTGTGCDLADGTETTVTVVADPNITTQPTSPPEICEGGTTANINIAAAGGTPSLNYQWQYYNGSIWVNVANGTPSGSIYSGATGTSFFVAGINFAGSYQYRCLVSASGLDCASTTSNSVTVTVTPLPTLSGLSQAADVCETFPATINLTGLLPGSISTVAYKIHTGGTLTATTTTANSSGDASFTTRTLTAADNGKIITVTGLTTTNATPNCSKTFSQYAVLIVNTATTPTITGNDKPCVNSSGNVYTTESGMSGYDWHISGGGVINSGSGTNSVSVTWNTTGGSDWLSVNYTNTNGCIASSPTVKNITVQSLPIPLITGPTSVCINSTGNIYATASGMLSYTWSIPTGGIITTGGTGNLIIVTWNTAGNHTVSVNYTNTNGCAALTPTISGVTVNPLPVPTLTGPATPRINSTGNVYSTESGMGSGYIWSVSGGGTITAGGTSTDNSVTVTWNIAGAQTVKVNYTNSNSCTAVSPTTYNVTVKPLPVASAAIITGTPAVGSLLTGSYTYTDGNGGMETGSTYRWLRNGTVPISGAVGITYTPTTSDVDQTITFEVTPASSVGPPNSGSPVQSSPTLSVENLIGVPVADQVCIEGIRAVGNTLKGKYRYIYAYKSEGTSIYQWYLNNIPISGATGLQYIITQSDIDSGKDITFEVTPVSSNHIPRSGLPVTSNPLARIILSQTNYSKADTAFLLKANITGGVYSGVGVSNGYFSPWNADTASKPPHTVSYLLNIVNTATTCSEQATVDISVVPINAYFVGLKTVFCYDDKPDTIFVENVPPAGNHRSIKSSSNLLSLRLTGADSTIIILDPTKKRPGIIKDTLTYSYLFKGSFYPTNQTYTTDSVGVAKINNLTDYQVFCNNDPAFTLYPSIQAGGVGVFTGPVTQTVSGYNMDPLKGNGPTSVTFKFTHPNTGCFVSVTVPVTINPAPKADFLVSKVCVVNTTSDSISFTNKTTSADPISIWRWEFFDAGGSSTKASKDPAYLFKIGGDHRITMKATTTKNCSATKDSTIGIGFKPVVNFRWKQDCYHPSDSIVFFDSTSSTVQITSRLWQFGTAISDTVSVKTRAAHIKAASGYMKVSYTVKTNFANCNATISKNVYIRPTITMTSSPDYFENFESGKNGWVKDLEVSDTTLWSFGKPNRKVINTAYSGNSAWYTGFDVTKQKAVSSWINSPCFDFTGIKRPMISIEVFRRFELNRDGSKIQYTVGDAGTWQAVGTVDDGINWYNSALIKGAPGGDGLGWTDSTSKWIESRHKIDELQGKKDVKFRIAYGSDGLEAGQYNDGFAFDDIRIGQRTRKVLLEHFTNAGSKTGSQATSVVTDLANKEVRDVVNIQYHSDFPGTDKFFTDNPGDASSRLLFYGLSRIPYAFSDGGTNVTDSWSKTYSFTPTVSLDSTDLIKRSLINPLFSITLDTTFTANTVTVRGSVKALSSISVSNATLYIAVTEKQNSTQTGALGETKFYNIFRKFLPDASGIALKTTWSANDTYTLTDKSWQIAGIPNSSGIELIVFIQNNITKEVYQAESIVKPSLNKVVGVDNIPAGQEDDFGLYPNPASDRLTVTFARMTRPGTEISIYDFKGSLVKTYKVGSGLLDYTINDTELQNGIYLVKVKSGGLYLGYKKLIISRN